MKPTTAYFRAARAVAIAARDMAGSVPEGMPSMDAEGLPMQIWF